MSDGKTVSSSVPTPIPVGQDDYLYVQYISSADAGNLWLEARLVDKRGRIQVVVQEISVVTLGMYSSWDVTLPEGYLLHCSVAAVDETVPSGSTYCTISLRRGSVLPDYTPLALAAGYIHPFAPVAWPGTGLVSMQSGTGHIFTPPTSPPLPTQEATFQVPARHAYRIHTIHATFTTSAAAASRIARIAFKYGGIIHYLSVAPNTQPASSTYRYTWSNVGFTGWDGNSSVQMIPYMLLPAYTVVSTDTVNMQANDQWSQLYIIAEQLFYPS